MISHSAIDSPIFKLIDTYQFDVFFKDDGYSLTIEIFQDIADKKQYRGLIWQIETVEVGVYVSDGECLEKDNATHHVQVDWTSYLAGDYSCFRAESLEEALKTIMNDIRRYLVHTSDKDN
ncbi:MAG: hypothetical protein VSS75_009020 [Candidatus Parabeggiatoa sp.]|nr:hypothetical protein [Candidatus Parabeggiatoa sp.]